MSWCFRAQAGKWNSLDGLRRLASFACDETWYSLICKSCWAWHPYKGCDSDGLWKAGFAAFPQPLENPPVSHRLTASTTKFLCLTPYRGTYAGRLTRSVV
jgi:hypothetical protein